MRRIHDTQCTFDRPRVEDIELNSQCRDPLVPVLRGLQHLYSIPDLRERVLSLVKEDLADYGDPGKGRKGLSHWQVTVLAAARLGCNFTYDHLQDLSENHRALMEMLQVGDWEKVSFSWHRIRDNVCLLKEETVETLNHLIVEAGHRLYPEAAESIRGDCFVSETNIHYPTDSSLILDGLRKVLDLGAELASLYGVSGWRQSKSLKKKAKRAARAAARILKEKGGNYQQRLQAAYHKLFCIADLLLPRTQELLDYVFSSNSPRHVDPVCQELMYWHDVTHHALRVAKQRVLCGEIAPNAEKIFSLFEPDTELIKRGKAREPVQFGHSVFVVEDAVGFICDYKVVPLDMLDQDIMIDRVSALQTRLHGKIRHGSFDRGFHTPENQSRLAKIIEHPCIPMTGPIQSQKQEEEATIEFRMSRQRHAGIESAIGALQAGNGMKRCRDRSSPGYKRYVGIGILGRNIHTLGKLLLTAEDPKCAAAATRRNAA